MEGLHDVEYLPEPTDRSIVSAVDPTVLDFQNEWRSEVMGWAPVQVEPVVRSRRARGTLTGIIAFAVFVSISLLALQNQWLVVALPLPDSEWAYEETNIRSVQNDGLSGDGVRLCMVDTGIDITHEALTDVNVAFKDLIGTSVTPLDYGAVAHGTLMSGILLAGDHQLGAAPNVTFAMVAALEDNGKGENAGLDSDVADAVKWCQFEFEADIISLSLGGTSAVGDSREGSSASAVRQATDAGVYVVAAAGNDGREDDGDVASPGSVALAISVGATQQSGEIWANSSVGDPFTPTGELRQSPHQKPEIVAPGERIISTGGQNLWYSSSGTSDSTVFVAGALALILEANPHLKPQPNGDSSCLINVKQALEQSARSSETSGHDEYYGYGSLDAKGWMEQSSLISAC